MYPYIYQQTINCENEYCYTKFFEQKQERSCMVLYFINNFKMLIIKIYFSADSGEATACSIKREDNLLSFRHFLCNNGHNQTSKPKVEVVPSVSQPVRPVTETSTLPDFVQDHLTTDQYDSSDLDSRSNSIDLTRGINRPSMFGNRSNRTPQQCVVMPLDLPFTNTSTQPRATTPTTTNSLPDFLSDGPIGVPVVHPVTRNNEQLADRNRISITINPQRGATPSNQNYIRFQRFLLLDYLGTNYLNII